MTIACWFTSQQCVILVIIAVLIVGIPDGKFLEKRKYKNVNNNSEFFSPIDLIVGNDIKINGWSFKLLDCDEFTRKWYAENFTH
jgi:hypothetical protein